MRYDELQDAIKTAMKNNNKLERDTLRQVHGELKDIEVNERRDIDEKDVDAMLKKVVKQTKETLDASIKAANDDERTQMLQEKVQILESYIPEQVSGDELVALVSQVIEETGASTKKDMGRVMGRLSEITGGNLDKAEAARIVGEKLS